MAQQAISIAAAVAAFKAQSQVLEPQRIDVASVMAALPNLSGDAGEIASLRLAGDAAMAPRIGAMHVADLTTCLSQLLLRHATYAGAAFSSASQAAEWAAGMGRELAAWIVRPRADYDRAAVQRLTLAEVDLAWRDACSSLDPEWAGIRSRSLAMWCQALQEYAKSPLAADVAAIVRRMRQPAVKAIAQRSVNPERDARITAAYNAWAAGQTRAESLRALADAEPDRFTADDAAAVNNQKKERK